MLAMITGGVKSGKSSRAIETAKKHFAAPVYFIATSLAFDKEMKARIERHKQERAATGLEFIVIEEPLDIDKALGNAGSSLIIDCIPMWVNNIIYYKKEPEFDGILERTIQHIKSQHIKSQGIKSNVKNCIVVTNETGLGNIPFDEATRHYNLLLAEANKKIAAAADLVEFMVSGIPLKVKAPPGEPGASQ